MLIPGSAYAYVDTNTGGFFFQTIAPFVYGLMGILFILWPCWKIFKKAGFKGAWALLMLIPIVNIVVLFIFAFSRWPALKNNE